MREANEQKVHQSAEAAINAIYETMDGSEAAMDYLDLHGVNSLLILTIDNYYTALREIEAFWPKIKGRVVVEIGAGVGMLALQMAKFAKQVYAIEADPAWAWTFTQFLYGAKPPNLTFVFGAAQTMVGLIKADVAVAYTRSDIPGMLELAGKFAPEVIHGPLCEFAERHGLGRKELEFIQRVGNRISIQDVGIRGIDPDALRCAIDLETTEADLATQGRKA